MKNRLAERLLKKIEERAAVVGIIGLGYVGLPLAVEFAKAGFPVIGYDLDAGKVKKINAGRSYIKHIPPSLVRELSGRKNCLATTDFRPGLLPGTGRPRQPRLLDRIQPRHNFNMSKGTWGAFELAARYSWMSLDDDNIRGGILNQETVGFNWQLNPNIRWMWNYVHSHVNGVGSADILETRFGVDF